MKYQAISIDYINAIREYEQSKKEFNLFLLGFKYGVWIGIIIILIIVFNSGKYIW